MKTGRRIFQSVVLVDLAAFVVFFMVAAFNRRADLVIPLFATKWELASALLDLIRWLPCLQFLALAIGIGSLPGKSDEIFNESVLPAVLLSAALSAVALILAPGLETTKGGLGAASVRFNAALAATSLALDQSRTEDARAAYGSLDAIDRGDARAINLLERLRGAELRALREKTKLPLPPPKPDRGAAKAELNQALESFRQRDYYAAWWHAKRAGLLDADLAQARKLEKQSLGEILEQGGEEKDASRAAFFARKMEAFSRLRAGDPVTAYRLFLELAAESPGDSDVRRYLAESLASIGKVAFFKDEADTAAELSVFPAFFVILPGEAGKTVALAASETALAPGAAFFFDLEYLEVGADGQEQAHYLSPYAKLIEGRLLLESVERENPGQVYLPTSIKGPEAPRSIAVSLDPVMSYRFAAGLRRPASVPVVDLYDAAIAAPRFKLDSDIFLLELLRRLGLPFALFGATILGALLGLRFRNPLKKPGKGAWLAFPVMATVSASAYLAIDYADNILARWTLQVVTGPAALAASFGIRAVILAVLVLIAASVREAPGLAEED